MADQASKVSGVVQIDGTPAQRKVRAFSYGETAHTIDGADVTLSKSLGQATSDPDTGEYTIYLLEGYGRDVFVVAFDDYGSDFTVDMSLAVGDRVHPTTPNGHVFECTSSGTLPSEEPAWVIDTETAQLYGTASMMARPFYRPMVHGPVAPEVTVIVVGDPHWDKVVSLLHFDGEYADEVTAIDAVPANGPKFVPAQFGRGIEVKTANNSYVELPEAGLWDFGSEDFTVELWAGITASHGSSRGIISGGYKQPTNARTWAIYINGGTDTIRVIATKNGTPSGAMDGSIWSQLDDPDFLVPNKIYHVALVRRLSTLNLYVDGILKDTAPIEFSIFPSTVPPVIGCFYAGDNNSANAVIDEVRITKGVARYTEDFTPPTEPFPNQGVDNGEPEPPALPTVIGEASGGGFYAGDIEDGGQWYKLIVADVEADVYGLPWGGYGTDLAAAKSTTDGPANTEAMRGTATYEAGNHCLDYRGGGFDDWYMPARSELQAIYENLGHNKTPPAGFESGGAQAFDAAYYWCSTQNSSNFAWIRRFSDGNENYTRKSITGGRVRPVRRIPFTPEAG